MPSLTSSGHSHKSSKQVVREERLTGESISIDVPPFKIVSINFFRFNSNSDK